MPNCHIVRKKSIAPLLLLIKSVMRKIGLYLYRLNILFISVRL
nr:hypothetical protein ELOWGMBK_ELOWGMBK_CDS_0028 [Herelleviridae sp.]CAI9752022.1 hypothetical protein QGKEIAJE_QGKEIAJE_CDS_0027 [uncultured phage]